MIRLRQLLTAALVGFVSTVPMAEARINRWKVVKPYNPKLERMAACESGKNWGINTGNGFFGGLQFVPSTWWSVGGRGMPHLASRLEQKYRAVLLIHRRGYTPWPICGRM